MRPIKPWLKWSTFIFSTSCIVAGALVVALSLMISFKPAYSYVFFNGNRYYGVILGAGAVLSIVGILGCVGALSRNTCLLYTFSICTGLIIVGEVIGGFFVYEYTPDFMAKLQADIKQGMELDYGENATITRRIDEIQKGWRCCGLNAHSSWSNSRYGGPPTKNLIVQRENYFVPETCCIDQKSRECQDIHRRGIRAKNDALHLHKQGCLPLMASIVDYYSQFVYVAITAVVVCQAIAMILSIIMAYRLRKEILKERLIKRDSYSPPQTSMPALSSTTLTDSYKMVDISAASSVRASKSSINLDPLPLGIPLSSLV